VPLSLFEPIRSLLWERREEKFARSISLEALDGFRRIHAALPDLTGEVLYAEVLVARFGVDEATGRQMVARARESYADWPVERDVRFSDVVHYFVAERCLKELEPREAPWVHGCIAQVVRDIIPAKL